MTLLLWAVRGWTTRSADRALLWLAARLPHRLICWVLAHVGAAAIRPDEHPAHAGWMDVVGRWERRWPELLFREGEPAAIREAAFQANLARVLADPACPFCTAEMENGRCPGCGHDPSTRGEPSAMSTGTPTGGKAEHPVYTAENLPGAGWEWFRKRTATRMVQIGGPATVQTLEGPVHLPVRWRGYLAVDEAGHPYPVEDGVHRRSYEPAGEPG